MLPKFQMCIPNNCKHLRNFSTIKQADGNYKVSGRGLEITRQRLIFDNYLNNICETTIEQIFFIATI